MFRTLTVGALALFLSGCSTDEHGGGSGAPKAPVVADAAATIDLGRETTCQGCVNGVNKALADVAGVGTIDLGVGQSKCVVHFDSKQVSPQQIVEALVKKEPKATLAQ